MNWAYWYGFLDNAITYSAEDGTQAFAQVNAGVYSPNPGSGFEFNVGAGLTERTVNVYVGTYRGQLKSPLRLGCYPASPQKGIAIHWQKARARGVPLEGAVVLGAAPHVAYPAVAFLPRV